MIKGTSQTFKFKVPCECSDILFSKVNFWQEYIDGIHILAYRENVHQYLNGNEILITLQPYETENFSADRKGYTQMTLSIEGASYATKQTMFTVYDNKATLDVPVPPPTEDYIIFDGDTIAEQGGA